MGFLYWFKKTMQRASTKMRTRTRMRLERLESGRQVSSSPLKSSPVSQPYISSLRRITRNSNCQPPPSSSAIVRPLLSSRRGTRRTTVRVLSRTSPWLSSIMSMRHSSAPRSESSSSRYLKWFSEYLMKGGYRIGAVLGPPVPSFEIDKNKEALKCLNACFCVYCLWTQYIFLESATRKERIFKVQKSASSSSRSPSYISMGRSPRDFGGWKKHSRSWSSCVEPEWTRRVTLWPYSGKYSKIRMIMILIWAYLH